MSDNQTPLNLSPCQLELNEEDIERYFYFLSGGREKEVFTSWIGKRASVNETKEIPIRGLESIFAPVSTVLKVLRVAFPQDSAVLHVLLNRTTGEGRRSCNVQSVRVLCVDLDSEIPLEDIRRVKEEYRPDMIVESSPKKYHLYWKVASEIPLEVWSTLQQGLAGKLGGDTNLSQVSHSIRVPGVPRLTKGGEWFTPRIVWLEEDIQELDLKEINMRFPWIYEEAKKVEDGRKKAKKIQQKILQGKGISDKERQLLGESRNRALFDYIVSLSVKWLKEHTTAEKKAELNGESPNYQEIGREFIESIDKGKKEPLSEREIETTIGSALKYALAIYEESQEVLREKLHDTTLSSVTRTVSGNEGKETEEEEFKYDYSDPVLEKARFSESALAARVLQRYKDMLFRCGNSVYAFNLVDRTWERQGQDNLSLMYAFVSQAQQDTINDERFIEDVCTNDSGNTTPKMIKRGREKIFRHGIARETVRSVLHSPKIKTIDPSVLDSQKTCVLLREGVLDLLTGDLRAALPVDYMLKRSSVKFDREATCDRWLEFLDQVFAENSEPEKMIEFTQELFGYSMSGFISAQKLFCHIGDGSNGKSKLMQGLRGIGGGYCTIIDPDDLGSKKNSYTKAMERIAAKTEGHRIVIIDDMSVATVWNEAFVKNLTSPSIRARAEHERSREIVNRCKIHIGLNQAPEPEAENEGLLRRMCLIPYPRRFEVSSRKSNEIDQMIEEESPGILIWAIEGFRRWYDRGDFDYPAEVLSATEEYREEHFKVEALVGDLFAAPETEEGCEPIFLKDLVDEVNHYLSQAGIRNEVTPDSLGIALGRKLKAQHRKVRCPKRRNSFKAYYVIRKYEVVKKDVGIL